MSFFNAKELLFYLKFILNLFVQFDMSHFKEPLVTTATIFWEAFGTKFQTASFQ